MRNSLLLGCILASSSVSAELQLPHSIDETLSSEQVNENIEYLTVEANAALAAIEQLQAVTTTPILERMSAGTEVTLATQGDLSVKASCQFNNGSESSEGFALTLWTESNTPGSLVYSDDEGYYGDAENTIAYWVDYSTDNHTAYRFDNWIDQGITVSPLGNVILMDGETFGYGINVQGSDCLISGHVISFQGDAAPEDFDADLIISQEDF